MRTQNLITACLVCAVFIVGCSTTPYVGMELHGEDRDLFRALVHGDASGVRRSLSKGANPNARAGSQQQSVLGTAIGLGDVAIVEALLGNGADPNTRDGGVPMIVRATGLSNDDVYVAGSRYRKGSFPIVDMLLRSGAEVNAAVSGPLQPALIRGSWTLQQGDTALIRAAWSGDISIASRLLEAGADIEAENAQGETALFRAAKHQRSEMVEYLSEMVGCTSMPDHNAPVSQIQSPPQQQPVKEHASQREIAENIAKQWPKLQVGQSVKDVQAIISAIGHDMFAGVISNVQRTIESGFSSYNDCLTYEFTDQVAIQTLINAGLVSSPVSARYTFEMKLMFDRAGVLKDFTPKVTMK